MPVNRRWSVDGLVEAPLVDQGNDLVLITKLVGIDRAVMTTQIDEHDGHVGGDRMVDAEQVSEIKPAIVLRIPPGEQEVGGAARLPGIGRRQIEKPVEGLDDRLAHLRILSVKRWPRQGRGNDSSI